MSRYCLDSVKPIGADEYTNLVTHFRSSDGNDEIPKIRYLESDP